MRFLSTLALLLGLTPSANAAYVYSTPDFRVVGAPSTFPVRQPVFMDMSVLGLTATPLTLFRNNSNGTVFTLGRGPILPLLDFNVTSVPSTVTYMSHAGAAGAIGHIFDTDSGPVTSTSIRIGGTEIERWDANQSATFTNSLGGTLARSTDTFFSGTDTSFTSSSGLTIYAPSGIGLRSLGVSQPTADSTDAWLWKQAGGTTYARMNSTTRIFTLIHGSTLGIDPFTDGFFGSVSVALTGQAGNVFLKAAAGFNISCNRDTLPAGDNTLDLGLSTGLRWRTGYFGTSVGVGPSVGARTFYQNGTFAWAGESRGLTGLAAVQSSINSYSNFNNQAFPTTYAPAGSVLEAGDVIEFVSDGLYSTRAAAAGTFTFTIRLNAGTVITTSGQTLANGLTNRRWNSTVRMTVLTTGVGGTFIANGCFGPNVDAVSSACWEMTETSASAIDTTAGNTFDAMVSFQNADAGNAIVVQNVNWRVWKHP